jgi:hypothetical protein
MGACILVIYLAVIYGTYVPHWQFTVNDRDSADYGKVFTVSTYSVAPATFPLIWITSCMLKPE